MISHRIRSPDGHLTPCSLQGSRPSRPWFCRIALAGTKGSNASYPNAINAAGDVIGVADNDTAQRAFLWERISDTRDLGSLDADGGSSGAIALNDNGQVAGYSSLGTSTHAFVWSDVAGMQDLGHLDTGNASKAYGINNAGQVVGSANTALGERGFLGQIVGTSNSARALLLTPVATP